MGAASIHPARPVLNVVIIEDNRHMRESWNVIIDFERDMRVTAAYGSCEEALAGDAITDANVIILDIDLPGISGIEGAKEIKVKNPHANIVMATVFEDDRNVFDSLKNGAVGYLSKKVSTSELLHAIRTAHNGGSPMSPTIARKVIESFHAAAKSSSASPLTEREQTILQHLAEGKSYGAIAKAVFLSVDGVSYHIRNIYEKLQVNSRGAAVREGLRRRLIGLFR